MTIQDLLSRLEGTLGQPNLSEQMLLYPGSANLTLSDAAPFAQDALPDLQRDVSPDTQSGTQNYVVGYNGSPNSQTALDFVLWMAYQTRQLTQRSVTVHVVYTIDCPLQSLHPEVPLRSLALPAILPNCGLTPDDTCGTVAWGQPSRGGTQLAEPLPGPTSLSKMLEHADRILWQARCLSDEWRGSLEAHLRFGPVATELRQVIDSQSADLLVLGCSSLHHPLVQQLLPCVTCPIVGIPTELERL